MEPQAPNDTTEQFLANIAAIRVKRAGRDRFLRLLGAVLMPVGVVLPIVAYFVAHNTDNALDQGDAIILALAGVATAIVGVGLFVLYSATDFLRFWIARLILQQEAVARDEPAHPEVTPE
jgi:hypothetical protein